MSMPDAITLSFPADAIEVSEDGEVARYVMTIDALQRWLPGPNAAALGLVPIALPAGQVRGEG